MLLIHKQTDQNLKFYGNMSFMSRTEEKLTKNKEKIISYILFSIKN